MPVGSDQADSTFVPQGARARWPFVVGSDRAYRRPVWKARPLLWWGVVEALLRIQPTKPSGFWRSLPEEDLGAFMHASGVGTEHPSRAFASQLVGARESVLDVGCGPGVNYEVLASLGRASSYVGIDTAEGAIEIARRRYPTGDFRVADAESLLLEFGERRFDVVIVRHVLEHLPDFEPVLSQAIDVSRRLAVFVFFLTPRVLPFGVRKLNLRYERRRFFHVYSRPAIDGHLTDRGVHFEWHCGVGESRTGWFAGEVNSVLVVSRDTRG